MAAAVAPGRRPGERPRRPSRRADAVRLFVERAHAVPCRLRRSTTRTPTAVAEICRRLDGIPLAIELAAARVVGMSPREIAELLDERFRLLTGGRRTAVERHQTLRATVDWSYSLLDPSERAVFDRLGVFAGAFDARRGDGGRRGRRHRRRGTCSTRSPSLVAKSMVLDDDGAGGTTRYQLLETLRHYARERLDDAGDADAWRRRHAEHYAAFAEEIGPALEGPDELAWRPRFLRRARQPAGRGDVVARRTPRCRRRPRVPHHRRARRGNRAGSGVGHRDLGRAVAAARRAWPRPTCRRRFSAPPPGARSSSPTWRRPSHGRGAAIDIPVSSACPSPHWRLHRARTERDAHRRRRGEGTPSSGRRAGCSTPSKHRPPRSRTSTPPA